MAKAHALSIHSISKAESQGEKKNKVAKNKWTSSQAPEK